MAEVLHQVYAKWDMMSDFIFARVTGFLAGFRISRVVLAELPSRHPELLVGFGSLDGKGFGRIWKVLRRFEAIRMWRKKSRFFWSKSCDHHYCCELIFLKSPLPKKQPEEIISLNRGGNFRPTCISAVCWTCRILVRSNGSHCCKAEDWPSFSGHWWLDLGGGPETKRIHIKATKTASLVFVET